MTLSLVPTGWVRCETATPPMSEMGLGCVKTCLSRECAELFSLISSFDGDCQRYSFLIQRYRQTFYAEVRRRSFHTAWVIGRHGGMVAGCPPLSAQRTHCINCAAMTTVQSSIDLVGAAVRPLTGCERVSRARIKRIDIALSRQAGSRLQALGHRLLKSPRAPKSSKPKCASWLHSPTSGTKSTNRRYQASS